MKNRIILYLFISVLLLSCEKEDSDYRTIYLGNYSFTVIRELWQINEPKKCDTLSYEGIIRKFAQGDEIIDLSIGSDDSDNEDSRITIKFIDNGLITPELAENGEFTAESGYHYNFNGEFIKEDSLVFVLTNLGGQGGGINYTVRGKRK